MPNWDHEDLKGKSVIAATRATNKNAARSPEIVPVLERCVLRARERARLLTEETAGAPILGDLSRRLGDIYEDLDTVAFLLSAIRCSKE